MGCKHKQNERVRHFCAYDYAYVKGVLTCFSGVYAFVYTCVLVKTRLNVSQSNAYRLGSFVSLVSTNLIIRRESGQVKI